MSASPPETLCFRANGIDFAALTWGSRGGPLALMLHGYPDSAWTWRRIAPRLAAEGRWAVAPFMRGYAPSGLAPDGGYSIGALARDALAMHVALGGDGRAWLIGHDWGAIAATGAAAIEPGRFAGVAVLSVPPLAAMFGALRDPSGLAGALVRVPMQLRRSWYIAFHQLPGISESTLDRVIPRLWSDWSPGYDAAEDLAYVFAALDSPARRTAAMRYYRALLQPWYRSSANGGDDARALEMPKVPLLVVHGRRDGCLAPSVAEGARPAVERSGGRVVMIEEAGHFLQLEQPGEIGDLLAGELPG